MYQASFYGKYSGMINSRCIIGGVLEKRLTPLPATLIMGAFVNHKGDKLQVGLGINVGWPSTCSNWNYEKNVRTSIQRPTFEIYFKMHWLKGCITCTETLPVGLTPCISPCNLPLNNKVMFSDYGESSVPEEWMLLLEGCITLWTLKAESEIVPYT